MERRFAARMQAALDGAVVDPRVFRDVQPRLENFLKPFVACLQESEQQEHARSYVTGLLSDRTFCLLRDAEVIITSWSDGRIPWPRCRAEGTHGGGSGLLVDEELARAVRSESADAIKHWFGVGTKAVWHWRKALGVDRLNNGGTHRLYVAAAATGGETQRGRPISAAERKQRSRRSKSLNLIRHAQARPAKQPWTAEQLALLGTAPDEQVAAQIGRTTRAVRIMRTRRGIPTAHDRRRVSP